PGKERHAAVVMAKSDVDERQPRQQHGGEQKNGGHEFGGTRARGRLWLRLAGRDIEGGGRRWRGKGAGGMGRGKPGRGTARDGEGGGGEARERRKEGSREPEGNARGKKS